MSLLTVQGLTRRFGGLTAIDRIDLTIESGEIRALIGPNGAGKTTLLNVLSGIYRPSEGSIFFKADPIDRLKPYGIARKGIGRTFQTARVFSELSVLENVLVAGDSRRRDRLLRIVLHGLRVRASEERARREAGDVLETVGLRERAEWPARKLTLAEQRLLEIARALALQPELILLDEPAAGMNPQESTALMALLRKLRDRGITLLLIEHDMRVVMGISDRISVLNFGKKIAEGTPEEIHRHPMVVEAYLGRATKGTAP